MKQSLDVIEGDVRLERLLKLLSYGKRSDLFGTKESSFFAYYFVLSVILGIAPLFFLRTLSRLSITLYATTIPLYLLLLVFSGIGFLGILYTVISNKRMKAVKYFFRKLTKKYHRLLASWREKTTLSLEECIGILPGKIIDAYWEVILFAFKEETSEGKKNLLLILEMRRDAYLTNKEKLHLLEQGTGALAVAYVHFQTLCLKYGEHATYEGVTLHIDGLLRATRNPPRNNHLTRP